MVGGVPASRNTTRVILHPEALLRRVELDRRPVGAALAGVVEHLWQLSWALPEGAVHRSSLASEPNVHLSVERPVIRAVTGRSPVVVTGPHRRRFEVDLRGTGWVYAAKFAVGALAAATGVPARGLTDRTVPAAEVVGAEAAAGWAGLAESDPADERRRRAEEILLPLAQAARRDPNLIVLQRLIQAARDDDTMVRVADLALGAALSVRHVQRLFHHYVGLTPKAVLRRYRMLDVVARLGADEPLAQLAARYGWHDQSHLTRDFTALVGVPPAAYRSGAQVR